MTHHGAPKSSISLAAVLAVSLAVSLATADVTSSEEGPTQTPAQNGCGNPGAPPCPLQAWMRGNIAHPLAANDLKALANGLDRTAKLSPDMAWASWPIIASQGAAAARKGDITAVRASCKSCHATWRDAYKAKFRNRPIPR